MGRAVGLTDAEVVALTQDASEHRWSEEDRDVLLLADQMTETPPVVDAELMLRLKDRLGEPSLVGLTAAIAFENYRSRFNRAMDVPSQGYDDPNGGVVA